MHFKLSARELGILEDRETIIYRLNKSQEAQRKNGRMRVRKPLKPPILVVANDDSELVAVIERDTTFSDDDDDDNDDDDDEFEEDEDRRDRDHLELGEKEIREKSGGRLEQDNEKLGRMQSRIVKMWTDVTESLARVRNFIRGERLRSRRQRQRQRRFDRRQRQLGRQQNQTGQGGGGVEHFNLSHGLAMSLGGAILSAGGPVAVADRGKNWLLFASNPMVLEKMDTLAVKCDVRILSDSHEVFKLLNGLLQ